MKDFLINWAGPLLLGIALGVLLAMFMFGRG